MEITFLKNKINGEATQVIHRREKKSPEKGCIFSTNGLSLYSNICIRKEDFKLI